MSFVWNVPREEIWEWASHVMSKIENDSSWGRVADNHKLGIFYILGALGWVFTIFCFILFCTEFFLYLEKIYINLAWKISEKYITAVINWSLKYANLPKCQSWWISWYFHKVLNFLKNNDKNVCSRHLTDFSLHQLG